MVDVVDDDVIEHSVGSKSKKWQWRSRLARHYGPRSRATLSVLVLMIAAIRKLRAVVPPRAALPPRGRVKQRVAIRRLVFALLRSFAIHSRVFGKPLFSADQRGWVRSWTCVKFRG